MAVLEAVAEDPIRTSQEDLQECAKRLCERFPAVSADRVLKVLQDAGGHAGYAAAELRALSTDVLKSLDPEDAEHVAVLLSNHILFKQTCRAQFKKFDMNQNGTLEWDEVLALTNHLCSYMGLEQPSEKSLQAFFEGSDTNHDGVLTSREFPKFFESFLRYAFFMQHRRLVGNWRCRSEFNDGHACEFTILLGKDYRLYYRSVRGGCPGTPKDQAQALQGRQEVHGTLEIVEGYLEADLNLGVRSLEKRGTLIHDNFYGIVRLQFAEGEANKVVVNFKQDHQASWGNDVIAKRRQSIEEERVSRCSSPTVGAILRCTAPDGVAYRRTPEFLEKTDVLLAEGDTVRILERHLDTHWVRVAGGWLPTVDPRGVKLFALETGETE